MKVSKSSVLLGKKREVMIQNREIDSISEVDAKEIV